MPFLITLFSIYSQNFLSIFLGWQLPLKNGMSCPKADNKYGPYQEMPIFQHYYLQYHAKTYDFRIFRSLSHMTNKRPPNRKRFINPMAKHRAVLHLSYEFSNIFIISGNLCKIALREYHSALNGTEWKINRFTFESLVSALFHFLPTGKYPTL